MESVRVRLSSKWLRERFLDHFIDQMSDAIGDTEFDLESELFNCLDVGVLSPSDWEHLQHLIFRSLLAEVLPQQVEFSPSRSFVAWSVDAFEFFKLNAGNSDFVAIFSSGVNYKVVLEHLLQFRRRTVEFERKVSGYLKTDLKGNMLPLFSDDFSDAILSLAVSSIEPALRRLGHDLVNQERRPLTRTRTSLPLIQETELTSSYKDRKGIVNFLVTDKGLSLRETPQQLDGPNYKALLDRAIFNLKSSRTLDRISNRDPILHRFMAEYLECISSELDADLQLLLFAIGQDIDQRIMYNRDSAADDEKVDGDALAYIVQKFITAHGLYVSGLNVVRQATSDIDRVNESFSKLSPTAKPIPLALLRTLTETESLFTPRTSQAVQALAQAVNDTNNTNNEPTPALRAMGIGTLRGSVRAMAAWCLEKAYRSAGDATTAVIKDELKKELANPGFQHAIVYFFLSNGQKLLELGSQMPHYFGGLSSFLKILH